MSKPNEHPQESNFWKKLLKRVEHGIVLICFVFSICVALIIAGKPSAINGMQPIGSAWVWLGLTVNFASALAAFFIAQIALQKVKDISRKEEYQNSIVLPILQKIGDQSDGKQIQHVPWGEFINGSDRIDFVVQGWNAWASHWGKEPLVRFFQREGMMNLFVHHDGADYKRLREVMRERISKFETEADALNEITQTQRDIASYIRTNTELKQLRIWKLRKINWFCAFAFYRNGQDLPFKAVLSPYAHKHGSVDESPCFIIHAETHPKLMNWLVDEISYLRTTDASEPPNESAESSK